MVDTSITGDTAMNKQRLKEFLLDNVGNDSDLDALINMVSQRGITDESNAGIAKAYDEVLRLRNLKADKYQLVADEKPDWKDLSEYEKLTLLGSDKQKQYYDEYAKRIADINNTYKDGFNAELPLEDRIKILARRKARIAGENEMWHTKLNNEPEPQNWWYKDKADTTTAKNTAAANKAKPKTTPKKGTKMRQTINEVISNAEEKAFYAAGKAAQTADNILNSKEFETAKKAFTGIPQSLNNEFEAAKNKAQTAFDNSFIGKSYHTAQYVGLKTKQAAVNTGKVAKLVYDNRKTIGKYALGGVVVAGVLANLMDNGGQQTNAQLYGQQPLY